ncbi:MAG: GTP cyclohydrolase, FolE2/MptA family, partial [Dechloromonas sp.]|nr:GTP cyclohydrolase, FolE2/MptA family [Dechloromonas sp.]
MNAPESIFLPDVQSSADSRQLPIQHVGVRGLRYPLRLLVADGSTVDTVASLSLGVGLSAEVKGTHMSRFVELLEANRAPLAVADLTGWLATMLRRLEATSGRIELAFPYFVRKTAPVSGVASLLDYDVVLVAEQPEVGAPTLRLRVAAPVTSLCPCSKKISDYGAHN